MSEQQTLLRLGRTACVVYHDAFSDYPAQIDAMGMWERVALAVATEVLTDPEVYAHALGLPEPRHFYVCNGCGKQHTKGEPCPDAHLLDTAAQRLGWLLFQAGKHASGTAMDQYCELGMVAARELLTDPAGWARALGLPEPAFPLVVDPTPCHRCGAPTSHYAGCVLLPHKPVDETAYLRARIGTVRQMLSKLTDSDFLSRMSMESHLAQMEAELAELAHQTAQE